MRAALVAFLLVGLTGLAGCGSASPCPATNVRVTAESGGTEDIPVRLEDGSRAVLHLRDAEIYRGSGTTCTPTTSSAIYAGMKLDIQVGPWAESEPTQGTPSVVILR